MPDKSVTAPLTDRYGRTIKRDGMALEIDGLRLDPMRLLDDAEAVQRFDDMPPAGWIEPRTPAQIIAALKDAVQSHLDATAQADDWDNIYTAALRASFAGPYQAKGIAYAQWMDACWVRCHEVEGEVMAGKRGIPSADELIGLLPVFEG